MHEMQTIVTDDQGVCLSQVQLSFTVQKLLNESRRCLGVNTLASPSNVMLDGGS